MAEHSTLPYDGATLIEAMHAFGINVRYIGTLVDRLAADTTRCPFIFVWPALLFESLLEFSELIALFLEQIRVIEYYSRGSCCSAGYRRRRAPHPLH